MSRLFSLVDKDKVADIREQQKRITDKLSSNTAKVEECVRELSQLYEETCSDFQRTLGKIRQLKEDLEYMDRVLNTLHQKKEGDSQGETGEK
jgi:ABC-type transporter Mla subunit MlaD